MTRTGRSPRLGSHVPAPYVEVHPEDAARFGLAEGGFAAIETAYGAAIVSVRVRAGQQRGSVFVPIHWTAETASHGRVGALVQPATDPISGQPEAKATPARIAPVHYAARGFALSRRPLALPEGTWWARVAVAGGVGTLLASSDAPETWAARIPSLFGAGLELAEYADARRGLYRAAAFDASGRLDGCLFLGPADAEPIWEGLAALFAADVLQADDRRLLLSGRRSDGRAATGPLVCACFGVGLAAIRSEIASGAADLDAIGKRLKAGTNCGSCRPEIRKILADTGFVRARPPAEPAPQI
jgi:assimilatory nitrate reductase catalytic subunit